MYANFILDLCLYFVRRKEKMGKILLVKPYRPVLTTISGKEVPFPIGLGYIAATLNPYYEVAVVDRDIELSDDQSFKNFVNEFSPDVVGISNMFTENRHSASEVSKLIADVNPNIPVIMGGGACFRFAGVGFNRRPKY